MSAGTLQGIAGSTFDQGRVTAVLGHGVGLGQGSVSGRARWLTMEWMLVTSILGDPSHRAQVQILWRRCKASGIVTEEESLTSHAGDWLAWATGDCGCEAGDESYSGWDSDFGYAAGLDLLRCFKRWLKGLRPTTSTNPSPPTTPCVGNYPQFSLHQAEFCASFQDCLDYLSCVGDGQLHTLLDSSGGCSLQVHRQN